MFDGFWYRCEIRHYSVADEWGDHAYTSTEVVWSKYAVVRETPKGVWLSRVLSGTTDPDCRRGKMDRGDLQLVIGTTMKQLACPTKELALADAIARKKRHVAGCEARLYAAQKDLRELEFEQLKFSPQSAKDVA